MTSFLRGLLAAGVFAGGCLFGKADDFAGSPPDLRAGFFLMHDVAHEETQVDIMNLIKTTPPDVGAYLKKVSEAAADTVHILDRFQNNDSSLQADHNPLPPFEIAVRAGIHADKEHELLFGTKGPGYVKAILLAQIEAANYLTHLAKSWAERDHDADRAATMRKVSARWEKLREEGVRLSS
jgi:hypothetical protein